jgi:hypothetical protein
MPLAKPPGVPGTNAIQGAMREIHQKHQSYRKQDKTYNAQNS